MVHLQLLVQLLLQGEDLVVVEVILVLVLFLIMLILVVLVEEKVLMQLLDLEAQVTVLQQAHLKETMVDLFHQDHLLPIIVVAVELLLSETVVAVMVNKVELVQEQELIRVVQLVHQDLMVH
jgi:hypothetical protein